MTTKKNVGTRLRPRVRTPEEQRKHRAEQAARAILAGRGNREMQWIRIARHLRDVSKSLTFAGMSIPDAISASAWPEPAPVESEPVEVAR